MSYEYYDIIIIGSGISGLYSAYNIKKNYPNTTFLILEKYKKKWIGGRTSNDTFYGTEIVTGAGIGRKKKDKLLLNLLKTFDFNIKDKEFTIYRDYSHLLQPLDLNKIIKKLKIEYQNYKGKPVTFKEFAKNILGEKLYNNFVVTSGYTDYENQDVFETLYYYGLEDNSFCWKAFHVSWKLLIYKLAYFIGEKNFRFLNNVVKIIKLQNNPCNFLIETENELKYNCNKVIVATTISSLQKLFPNNTIYNDIVGQP
jgi:protoporphyrinogen oxidase